MAATIRTSTRRGVERAQAPHRAVLDGLQELRLERHVEEPDLVEEERAAVGGLEEPRLARPRVRVRALLESEELALEERARDRGAVDLDERA